MNISPATVGDWGDIERIYREGIHTGQATFQTEEEIPTAETWFAGKVPGMVFKAEDDASQMLGWCALSPTSKRRVYVGVTEVSVYVAESARGRGVGRTLLTHLIAASEAAGIWTLQAVIFPENEASIRLHRQCGFRTVGLRHKLGQMHGVWRDVLLMERRSELF